MHGKDSAADLTIGQVAAMSRLTIRALRHYDEIGLLRPRRVDPDNGYRYYSAEQIVQAGTIAVLRGLDIDTATIGSLLAGDVDVAVIIAEEQAKLAQIEQQRQAAVEVLESLSAAADIAAPTLGELRGFSMLGTHVRVRAGNDIAPVAHVFAELFAALEQSATEFDPDGVCVIRRNTRDEMSLDVGARTTDPTATIEGYGRIEIAGGPTATAVHAGPLTSLPLGHARLAAWVHARGLSIEGPARETYVGPLEDQRTEISVRVAGHP